MSKYCSECGQTIADDCHCNSNHELSVGKKVFIRTVTYHYTGLISEITDKHIVLKKAAWVADSDKFSTAMQTGSMDEVEVYPKAMPVFINREAIVDLCLVEWDLPSQTR